MDAPAPPTAGPHQPLAAVLGRLSGRPAPDAPCWVYRTWVLVFCSWRSSRLPALPRRPVPGGHRADGLATRQRPAALDAAGQRHAHHRADAGHHLQRTRHDRRLASSAAASAATSSSSASGAVGDLLGKLRVKPVYELLGAAGGIAVPVYDGSIYFADLLPEYEAAWQDRFREELDVGLSARALGLEGGGRRRREVDAPAP